METRPSSAAPSPLTAAGSLLLVLPLFLGSGAAALIYEVVWFQVLGLVVGSTAISLGVLLATFMGGMCAGSLLLPRFATPRRHPLRVYAALEAGIAVVGLLLLYVLPLVERVYTFGATSFWVSLSLRALLSALCLVPPTLLMGATLPAVARFVESTPRGASVLGVFYAGNIVGAVIGCVAAGFYLLRLYDVATATYAAVATNLIVAGVAGALSLLPSHAYSPPGAKVEAQPRGDGEPASPTTASRPEPNAILKRLSALRLRDPSGRLEPWLHHAAIYVAIALSGSAALGAETLWTRLLALTLAQTVYTFAIILAVFLAALGIGSGIGSLLCRDLRHPAVGLGLCQLLVVLGVAWAAHTIAGSIPNWPVSPRLATSPWFTFQLDVARTAWAILPAALAWGASFPFALAARASRGEDPARLVGRVYAANTVGAIGGALCFGLYVLPSLGTQAGSRLMIVLATAAALIAWAPSIIEQWHQLRTKRLALALGVVAVTAGAIGLYRGIPGPNCNAVAHGRYSATWAGRTEAGLWKDAEVPGKGSPVRRYCTYLGEGLNVSVAVTKDTRGIRYFHGAGKVQASTLPADMRLQRLLGHITVLAKKDKRPKSVLVVALGAGVTAGSFTQYESVERIVICDIEPLVPREVAPRFARENYDVLGDPRTTMVVDDGRHFVRTTDEKFDIITSDPIDPWVKGCAALNTEEYYRMCRDRLNPGGVMALWMPLYESDLATTKSLIATFFKVFPHGVLWSNDPRGKGYDAVLFGSLDPIRIDVDGLQTWLQEHPRVTASLREVGFGKSTGRGQIRNPAVDLLATYAGRPSDLRAWLRGAEINRDENLRLQFLAGMALNLAQRDAIFRDIYKHYRFPDDLFTGSDATLEKLREALRPRARLNRGKRAKKKRRRVGQAKAPGRAIRKGGDEKDRGSEGGGERL